MSSQVLLYINGIPHIQYLHPVKGPVARPITNPQSYTNKYSAIAYPTTHSIPGPFVRSYIGLTANNKKLMY